MPTVSTTTSSGQSVSPTGGMTLDALMARQKELADRAGQIAAPRQMVSPWQGLAAVAQQFVNARQEGQAQDQLSAGRQQLAQAMSKIDPTTGQAPQDAVATAMALDPDTGLKLLQSNIEAARAVRQRQQQLEDTQRQRDWTVLDEKTRRGEVLTDAERVRKQQLDDVQTGYTHEATTHARDVGEAQTATAAAQKIKDDEHARQIREGEIKVLTPDEAKAKGLDTRRQWAVKADGSEIKDITPTLPDTYREPTPEERQQYGMTEGQPYKMKISNNGTTVEPVSIGSGMQLVPPEFASKIALGDEFLSNYDNIRAEAAKGTMTGPIDYGTSSVLGRGSGGVAYRQLKQGSEALLRMLTGAGVSETEAASQVQQYEPSMTDDANTLVSKIDGLKAAMTRIRSGATQGRQSLPPPASKPPPVAPLPAGVSEDDIAATMAARKMTRQQVLDALAAKQKAP